MVHQGTSKKIACCCIERISSARTTPFLSCWIGEIAVPHSCCPIGLVVVVTERFWSRLNLPGALLSSRMYTAPLGLEVSWDFTSVDPIRSTEFVFQNPLLSTDDPMIGDRNEREGGDRPRGIIGFDEQVGSLRPESDVH